MNINLSEKIASGIVNYIKKHDPDSSSPAVLKYDLIPKINLMFCCVLVLIICGITGHIIDGLLSCLGFTILRNNSGGIHFNSELECNIVSIIMILTAVYIPLPLWYYIIILNVLSLILTLWFAPSHSKKLEIKDPKLAKRLKVISVCLVASNFLFNSHVLAAAFFIQSLTLLKGAQRIVDKLRKEETIT